MATTNRKTVESDRAATVGPTAGPEMSARPSTSVGYLLAVLRLFLGWTFFWAFLDKTFGLGFATPAENAWVSGGSPTSGYLAGVDGPFAAVFHPLTNQAFSDWLFMAGLLGIGLALLLGIGMRIAAASGAVLLVLMYLASLPLDTNPFMDSHLVEALLLVILARAGSGRVLGLGDRWRGLGLVRRNPWLR